LYYLEKNPILVYYCSLHYRRSLVVEQAFY
jgi:hypothetical protein